MIFIILIVASVAFYACGAEAYFERSFPRRTIGFALAMAIALLFAIPALAQSNYARVGTFTATATGQTSQAMTVSGQSVAVIGAVGTTLTTATFQVLGSIGCTTFSKIIPIRTIGVTPASALSETIATTDHFAVNVAGWDCIEIQTTGTFTATSVVFNVGASPNGVVSRFHAPFPELEDRVRRYDAA